MILVRRLRPTVSEEGFVLVTAMLILVVLSFIGLAATGTALLELRVSGNDREARARFYEAEAAAFEAAQRLENESVADFLLAARTRYTWLRSSGERSVFLASDSDDQWNDPALQLTAQVPTGGSTVRLAAFDYGVVKGTSGSSIKVTASSVHEYRILGRAEAGNTRKLVEIGYRKRF